MGNRRIALVAAALAVALLCAATSTLETPVAHADPGAPQEFAITSEVPALAELDARIRLLVGTAAPGWVKAAQLESGDRAVIVP
jgi:hypothetical protein